MSFEHPTPNQAAEYLMALEEASRSFPAFVRIMFPKFKIPRFHEEIMDALNCLEKGTLGKQKLMLNLPVRHGKSWLVSTCFALYYITRKPNRQNLASSFRAHLAHNI